MQKIAKKFKFSHGIKKIHIEEEPRFVFVLVIHFYQAHISFQGYFERLALAPCLEMEGGGAVHGDL